MVGGDIPRMLQAHFFGLWGSITGGQKFRFVAEGPNKGLADLKELIESGKVVPVVDKRYKLSEVPEAFRYFTEGLHAGKIVVDIES